MRNRTITFCLMGAPELKEHFWKRAVIDEGLEDNADVTLQANGVHGRNRDNHLNYPSDWVGRDLEEVSISMYNRVRGLLRSVWSPKPYSSMFIDYEPRRYASDRKTVVGHWMLDILRHGIKPHDIAFLDAMISGAREAGDGLPLSMYTVPRLPKGPMTKQARANIESALPITKQLDWDWLHGYETGNSDLDFLDRENLPRHISRVQSQRDGMSVSGNTPKLFLWPSYNMSKAQSKQYNAPTIQIAHRLGITDIGIWVDLTYEYYANKQTENTLVLAQQLRQFVDAS